MAHFLLPSWIGIPRRRDANLASAKLELAKGNMTATIDSFQVMVCLMI